MPRSSHLIGMGLPFQPIRLPMRVAEFNPSMKTIIASLLCGLGVALLFVCSVSAADSRLYEMRVYFAAPGKLDDLNARFRNHTVALFEKHGMENLGYWVPVDNKENKLVYILAYPSREARQASW